MSHDLDAFLARYPDRQLSWPAGATDPTHTHGGNRFWTFEGTSFEFCSACALGLPPDPRPAPLDRNSQEGIDTFTRTDPGPMDPRD